MAPRKAAAPAVEGLPGLGDIDVSQLLWAWRLVRPDFTSSHKFRWPFPGSWAEAPGPFVKHKEACPAQVGDGLCLAKNWHAAALGGIRAGTILFCAYLPGDVLGEDDEKLRVRRAYVGCVLDAEQLLRSGLFRGADLRGAHLGGADLGGAYLGGADLGGAYLGRAYLGGADLTEARHDDSTRWPEGFQVPS